MLKIKTLQFQKSREKISASKGVIYKAIKNNTDISAKWIGALVENYPILSANYILTGKGDMLLSGGAAAPEPEIPEIGAAGEANSLPVVADERQEYYRSTPTEQVLRQLVSALERTIKDKDKIISLLEEKQSK